MPKRAKRPCPWPGCGRAVYTKYCSECEPKAKKRDAGNRSPSEFAWVYKTTRWKRLRALVLVEEPICQACRKQPSNTVDHIKAMAAGGDPWDRDNLQALDRVCHSRKTALEDGRWGKSNRIY